MITNGLRLSAFCLLAFSLSAHYICAQTSEEGEIVLKKQDRKIIRTDRPIGKPKAQNRRLGVLFVLTDPPAAVVRVKNSRGTVVKQLPSDRVGEFRAELQPGRYSIEVTAPNYLSQTKSAEVSSSREAIVPADLDRDTGTMEIGPVRDDVKILLNDQDPSRLGIKMSADKEEQKIVLSEIPQGYYKLNITHPEVIAWERKKVEVRGGYTSLVFAELKSAVAKAVVKTEPGAGIYVDDVYQGQTDRAGSIPLEVKPGAHKIEARLDGYYPNSRKATFSLDKEEELKIELTPIAFKAFEDSIGSLDSWIAPKGWQKNPDGGMLVRGPGVGFAKDTVNGRPLVYKDFTLIFDISLRNGRGAAWVVRARDEKNYYLFQLTGPSGSSPKRFYSFICQDGEIKALANPVIIAEPLNNPTESFTIIVEAKGSTITHKIALKSAPKTDGPQPLSPPITDYRIPIGAIGFATKDDEQFLVKFVGIAPR